MEEFIIIFIIVLIVIFLIARQFWCWYWKINELEKINENLEQIKGLLIHENTMLNRSAYNSEEDELPEL